MPEPHWTAYISAFLTPIIAILAALIAYRQWQIARSKLKFDLLDRRMAVYDAAIHFIAGVLIENKVTIESLLRFRAGVRATKWLLNSDIHLYLNTELWDKVREFHHIGKALEGMPVGDERTKKVNRQDEILKWLTGQQDAIDKMFDKYLAIE